MNHIFENIKNVEAMAGICQKDIRQYQAMRNGDSEQWEMDAFIPQMDDNNYAFTEAVRKLNLDNQDEMIKFIKAIKALGAVETLERMQESEEFSTFVNIRLEGWANRITSEVTDD
jgi:hypothetical protein